MKETKLFFFKSIKSQELIDAIKTWIEQKGIPKHLISDDGGQYISTKFKDYLLITGIIHIYNSNVHPRSNEVSERINQTIAFILAISKHKDIKEAVKMAKDTLNINYNRGIKVSPYLIANKKDFYDVDNKCQNYLHKI